MLKHTIAEKFKRLIFGDCMCIHGVCRTLQRGRDVIIFLWTMWICKRLFFSFHYFEHKSKSTYPSHAYFCESRVLYFLLLENKKEWQKRNTDVMSTSIILLSHVMSATLLSMFLNPQLYIVFFRIAQSFFAPFILTFLLALRNFSQIEQ